MNENKLIQYVKDCTLGLFGVFVPDDEGTNKAILVAHSMINDEIKNQLSIMDIRYGTLMTENDGLRKYLKLIEDHPVDETGQFEVAVKEMKNVANKALNEKY